MIGTSPTMRERWLREEVRVIRHLPPGTPLPFPSNPEIEQLLDDLVRLPDEVDPLGWLQAERVHQVAGITLLSELQYLRQTLATVRRRAEESLVVQKWLTAQSGQISPRDATEKRVATLVESIEQEFEQRPLRNAAQKLLVMLAHWGIVRSPAPRLPYDPAEVPGDIPRELGNPY